MNDELDHMTDAALSEAFAVECAGCSDDRWYYTSPSKDTGSYLIPPFATSADAVLPFLAGACRLAEFRWNPAGRLVLHRHHGPSICVDAPTFARAACIALIRAKRSTKRVHVDQGIHPEDAYAKRAMKGLS